MTTYNLSAGPCILPKSVFEEASQAVLNFNNSGLSILEISHRSPAFMEVMDEAVARAKKLMGLGEDYELMFLQGGASLQFTMVAQNLLRTKAGYVDTGTWANKAIKEAKLFGEVAVLASSADDQYNHIPKGYDIPDGLDYLHLTSNNTIFGTQIHAFPETAVPLVCDMSSDIFSRDVNFNAFDLIYAGAQKNLGPAGTTLVAVKKSALGKSGRAIPSMLNYAIHADKGSMFNTPPVFSVYVSMLTLRWIEEQGGIGAVENVNRAKASLLYGELDRNSQFRTTVATEDRSMMNVTFHLENSDLEETFNNYWKSEGFVGLKGHRSVGGYRASIYNAFSLEQTEALVQALAEFERKHG